MLKKKYQRKKKREKEKLQQSLFREHVDDFEYCSLLCMTLNTTLIGSH